MATETLEELGAQPLRLPRAGWVDRLIDLPDRLPGPAVLWFAVLFAGIVTAAHLPLWVTAASDAGVLEAYLVVPSTFIVYLAALGYILRRVARSAFADFRPALGEAEDDQHLAFELARMPDRSALAAALLSLIVLGIGFLFEPPTAFPEPIAPLAIAVSSLVWWLAIGTGAIAIAYIVRQLRLVSRLHRMARNVDIFDPSPINAFSKLTATAAIGILIVAVFFVLPADDEAYVPLATGIGLIALAIASFVLPLRGMHKRLVIEKKRLLSGSHGRLKQTLSWIHGSVDARDLAEADHLQKTLTSLLAERDVLTKLSTWPWSPDTIRGFVTAALLPIALWLVIRALERFL